MKRRHISPALSVPFVLLVLGLSLLAFAPAALAQEEEEEDLGAALDYFLLKRSPDRVSPIPVEKYTDALEHMKQMPQHATSTGRTLKPMAADPQGAATAAILEGWTPLGPGNIGGRTRALIIDPVDPQTMYAAGVDGGVWKTTNGGAAWRAVSDALPNIAVVSLAMDPNNRNVIYAGTGEGFAGGMGVRGGGIFKTTDAGTTWTLLPGTTTSDFYVVPRLVISPNNPARLYAATGSGLWRSLDGGSSWARMLFVSGGCDEVVIRTDMPNDYLFAACGLLPNYTIWRAKAAELLPSSGWEALLNEPEMGRTTLAIAPSDQRIVYALSADAGSTYGNAVHAVFRSSASGDAGSWVAQVRQTPESDPMGRTILTDAASAMIPPGCTLRDPSGWRSQGFYDNAIAVDPRDPNIVWAGGIHLYRSSDGGRTWGRTTFFLHADQHLIVFHPAYDGVTNQTMFVTNDGGLFRTQSARGPLSTCSNPQGEALGWTSLNHGYQVTQFYHGLPYPDGTRYFGGTQDNGTVRGGDATGLDGWETLSGGDGGWVAIDPRNPNVFYVTVQGGVILRTEDGGRSYVYNKRVANQIFLAPLVMDPSAPDRLWTGGTFMQRTSDGGFTWTAASAPITGGDTITSIAVSPTDSNRVLVGTAFGKVLRTTSALTSDGATVWPSAAVGNGFVSGVAFDPVDPNIVYATVSTFGGPHVLRSTDGGATWVSIDGSGTTGLPDIPVNVILVDPTDRARLYIGTDAGVLVSTDGGATWAVEITGFAAVSTNALSITAMNGVQTLFAFTFGRGAWRVATGSAAPGPRITALTPSSGAAGGPGFTLTVTGSGFVSGSTVNWNGASRPRTFLSATQLTASIAAGDIAAAGSVPVTVRNPDGSTSNTATFTITSGGPCPLGQYFAEYFSNTTLTPPATRTACENAVNYDWGTGGPAGLPVDNFSVRWTGNFQFGGGTTTFVARADDGIRVFLSGTLIIDQWHDQPATSYSASRTLTPAIYQVKIEYYERGGDAVAQVGWTGMPSPPAITTLTPSTANAGGPAFTLTVDGSGFVPGFTVLWNGAARPTTFVSGTRLTAAIPASDIASAGSVPVTVLDTAGQTSNALTFTVSSGGCPAGQFLAQYFSNTTLTPPATRTACEAAPINYDWGAGGPAALPVDNFSVRWTGVFQFAGGSVTFTARADDGIRVLLDGAAIIDQFHDEPATTYTAIRTVSAGQHEVKVEYYERGGDAVAQVSWTGGGPVAPTLATLTPNNATAGGAAFTLTADGNSFVSGATVLWNGTTRATTFVSATRVTASIPASDIAAAGSASVSVRNPDGQTSNTVTFTVNPAGGGCPTGQFTAQYFSNIALTPPATRTACETTINNDWGAGGPAGLPVDNFSVRWTGQFNFAGGSVTFTARADDGIRVFLDGVVIIDQFHDQPATTYTATVNVAAGTHEVKVEYYERGGDAVAQVSWINNGGGGAQPPTLTTLTPNNATAGGAAFTLTADGSNFVSGATVLWNGAARTTTFVSATRLTASIPASDIAAAGSASVTVRNPDAQTSGPQTFTISPSGGGDTIKVIITSPANGSTVRGTVWFTIWIENAAAGTKTYTLTVNGTTITSTPTTSNGPVSMAWPTSAADNGSRTATVIVRDSAGATGRASITVTVAN
ncbi:MAG TPA: PA14 domain-containing protein [Methylomirabilota bacterium]